jgi:hypothetical protein
VSITSRVSNNNSNGPCRRSVAFFLSRVRSLTTGGEEREDRKYYRGKGGCAAERGSRRRVLALEIALHSPRWTEQVSIRLPPPFPAAMPVTAMFLTMRSSTRMSDQLEHSFGTRPLSFHVPSGRATVVVFLSKTSAPLRATA